MAIVRVQYGSRLEDKHYKTHIKNFKQNNVPIGVYAWVRGVSNNDMRKEARDFFKRASSQNPQFYVLDIEEQSMKNMREGISNYLNELRKYTGKKIGAYISHHQYEKFNIDTSKFDFIWIPHYGKNDGTINSTPRYNCHLHQYTDKGKLKGYNGYLDLNRRIGKKLEFFLDTYNPIEVKKSNYQIAQEVLNGKWGNGKIRKDKLEKAGYQYSTIQSIVNQKLLNPYKNKKVFSKVNKLRFYSTPSWEDKYVVGYVKKNHGFPIILEKIKVGNGEQYKVKNSKGEIFYITASPKYVYLK